MYASEYTIFIFMIEWIFSVASSHCSQDGGWFGKKR